MKKWIAGLLLFCMCAIGIVPAALANPETEQGAFDCVMMIPVDDVVELGLSSYLERNIARAEDVQADAIVLVLDTPGGRVDAAQDIKRILYSTDIHTIAFVKDQAISAGAYIALCCDEIIMAPGSTIGDAEMLINGERADEKYLGPWREEFAAIAEDKGRDPEIAKAFVDRDIAIEGVIEAGKLLTLTPQRAIELGMADGMVKDETALLESMGAADARIVYGEMNGAEKITRFVTNPNVAPLLLAAGILLLAIEFVTPGVGIFAILGIILLALYFGGHMIAGMASWFALLLFVVGIILCFIEILVPGFGIFAIGGIGCIVGSIFLTTPDVITAVKYLTIVLVAMAVCAPIILKLFSKSKLFDRLLVRERLTTEDGYVAGRQEQADYIGACGVAATTLRPSGTVELEDGTRIDVVTRGEFIEKGESVQVVHKEGTWLVVEKRRK
ncbi:MAG: nodulation protein NfeD [Peptococcaceae bacterium]|nr:nodulation protein NfeD [Peptococcaceae bacterium]